MSFIVTNIAGSFTIGAVGKQQAASAEQDATEAYQTQMTREMRARSQQMEEEVAATEEDTEKRVGQAPDRRGRRQRNAPHHDDGPAVQTGATEDIVDVHTPVAELGSPPKPGPKPGPNRHEPPEQINLLV